MELFFVFVFGFIILPWIFSHVKQAFQRYEENRALAQAQAAIPTDKDIRKALSNKSFGTFTLTQAVAICPDSGLTPREGYKRFREETNDGFTYNFLAVSVSAERLFDVFDELVSCMANACGVALEDHRAEQVDHVDYIAHQKDTVVVRSILRDFEDMVLDDGFLGVAVFSESDLVEVQISDHKLIYIMADDLNPFQEILFKHGIREDQDLAFIFDVPHFHIAEEDGEAKLEALKDRLCIDMIAEITDGSIEVQD